ncbi:MAG: bifunctional demethylmenaquinone methyltransferase/2-methoxy-6-polyprenyl-1,4-benzoquinol methylase UbiE [Alphaproteobacteria bacterium]|nr:bifunctional demethylmenaquinone methyltransferase/2-methoxy-6-polyprenyl-1,4-benzoquinol methylase UbiE [Alphaproteobacteria bacterium]
MHYLNPMTNPSNTTSFGFRTVAEEERQGLVNDVFSKAAADYDKMNDLMSSGLHRLWKDDMMTMLNPPKAKPFQVLDVAGGTGDIAFRILDAGGPQTRVTVADISPHMVAEGQKRGEKEGRLARCAFTVGNAEELAFPDNSFDAYTIAFGIRNVTHIQKALGEAHRVLKPGGRFLCLEFSHMDSALVQKIYDAYSFTVIPAVGKVVTGDGQPYRYLVESIRMFPKQEEFAAMIRAAGFAHVTYRNLTGGVAAIHSGWKI